MVGGGCRGLALARSLVAEGHAVRAVTRDESKRTLLEEAGCECWIGDPDRIGTLMDALYGVTVVVWLAGTVEIPEGRLRMLWEKLVDTGVRGVVHEGPYEELSRTASDTWQIPLAFAGDDPHAAVNRLLGL